MLVKVYAAAVQGVSAMIVTIEVNCSKGIQFFLVGLPDVAVRESHERIISALEVCGIKFPRTRIVINMSPADIRKEGTAYDLPLAIGILAGSGTLATDRLADYLLMGELSLDGMTVALDTQTDRLLSCPSTLSLVKAQMMEVIGAANALGVEGLDESFADKMIRNTQVMVPYSPSMKLDYDFHRPMEIEFLYTRPIAEARAARRQSRLPEADGQSRDTGEAKG